MTLRYIGGAPEEICERITRELGLNLNADQLFMLQYVISDVLEMDYACSNEHLHCDRRHTSDAELMVLESLRYLDQRSAPSKQAYEANLARLIAEAAAAGVLARADVHALQIEVIATEVAE